MYLHPSNRKHARSNVSSIGYILSSIACILGLTFATAAAHAQGLVVSGSSFTVGTTPQGMATGDLNTDGHPDMVVANSASNSISVLLSNGIGTYATAVNYATGTK
ncbi:MAG TPA: VCBS repeat-containing protein, partial [Acidobacteriaceae bacterium]|nr:VCBS repeat-containing protein [Acidobacteriaceae bacterium]